MITRRRILQNIDEEVTSEYVDLGLPSGLLWAKCNVGASSETEYGNYYQYGKGARTYQETYDEPEYEGVEDTLVSSLDTATQVMGHDWRTPTKDEYDELIANTTYEWVMIDNVYGGKFTGQNGKYIFFPAAGNIIDEGDIVGIDNFCVMTTSSKDNISDYNAVYGMEFAETYVVTSYGYGVFGGRVVRAVHG